MDTICKGESIIPESGTLNWALTSSRKMPVEIAFTRSTAASSILNDLHKANPEYVTFEKQTAQEEIGLHTSTIRTA